MPIPLLLHGRHAPTGSLPPVYEPFGPWLVPWRFSSLEEDYTAIRDRVGLLDYSTQALIEVRGTDRVAFLHALLTNDVVRLQPGQGCRAALLDPSARLLAECLVLSDPETVWLLCDLERAGVLMQTFERYQVSEDVTFTNHERRWVALALQGPRTFDCLHGLLGRPATTRLAEPLDHGVVEWQETAIRLIRFSLAGQPGCLCLLPAESAWAAWQHWLHAGVALGLRPVGWEALNVARMEAGVPWFGLDMDETNLLPETGLEATLCSETKGCYLGQEIIARMRTYGSPSKKLMGVLIERAQVPAAGSRLERDGLDAGSLTSACLSPALNRPIALGSVKRVAYEPGTRVEVVGADWRAPATVVALPFLKITDR